MTFGISTYNAGLNTFYLVKAFNFLFICKGIRG